MEKGLSLDSELVLLITTQSSLINGRTFCADLHRAQAVPPSSTGSARPGKA